MSEFAGFPAPTKNFFSLPNEITDIIAGITNLSELKILIYVIRHTWGYREFGISKAITNDEFMYGRKYSDGTRMDKGTGLSEQGVRDGANKAVKDGYLICEVDDSDKGRIKKSYRLRMMGGVKTLDPQTLEVKTLDPSQSRGQDSMPPTPETLTSGLQTLDPRPMKRRPRTEKETLERNSRKTPEERKGDDPPTSSSPDDSSFNSSSVLNSNSSVRGAISSANGRSDSPIASTTEEMQEEQNSASHGLQGYRTETSEPLNNDAVMQNSTVSEAELLSWLATLEKEETVDKIKRFAVGRIAEKPADMARLLLAVHGPDDVRDLYKSVRSQKLFSDGRIMYALSLAREENIAAWQEAASEQAEQVKNELMNERLDKGQADEFAGWLMRKRGFAWDAVAIDNPYMDPNIWEICLRYGDGEDDWLRIRNWWHFNHLEDWEQELYVATGYNDEPVEQAVAV